MAQISIARLPRALELKGVGRTKFYQDIARGTEVTPVRLGARARGWILEELQATTAARAAGFDDNQLRALVVGLIARRAELVRGMVAESVPT